MIKIKKIKYIIAIIFSCLSIFSIYYFSYLSSREVASPVSQEFKQNTSSVFKEDKVISKEEFPRSVANKDISPSLSSLIGVTFEFGGKTYSTKVSQDSNVLDLMNKIKTENSDFDFVGREYPGLGFFVDSINNKSNTNFSYWIYYVNERQAEVGISAYVLKDGDIISWRLE